MFARSALFCAALAASAVAAAADSDVDSTFGIFGTGHNVVSINGGAGNKDTVADVLVAPDNSLYLVGTSTIANGDSRITLVHLKADGTLDTDYGTNGRFVGPPATYNTQAAAAAFDDSGDIIVGGTRTIAGENTDFVVCKFHDAGVVQFGNTNLPCVTVAFDVGGTLQDTARDVVVLKDHRIALVGSSAAANGVTEAAVAIINPDGTPDTGFGSGGKRHWIVQGLNETRLYAAVQSGLVLYVVGDARQTGNANLGAYFAFVNTGTGVHQNDTIDFLGNTQAFYRDLVVGSNAQVFAAGGVFKDGKYRGVVTHLAQVGSYDVTWANGNGFDATYGGESLYFTKMARQSDGKFLVAGTMQASGNTSSSILVGRYNASGSRDVGSFNILMGYRTIDFQTTGSFDFGAAIAVQASRPVVVGSVQAQASSVTDYDFGVARLQNDLIFVSTNDPQD